MAKIKTSELTGAALDWAVAKAEGAKYEYFLTGPYFVWPTTPTTYSARPPEYSTDWSQGGPIIEREDLSFRKYHRPDSDAHGTYYAMICKASGSMIRWDKKTSKQGSTPLIAAMRCYVASKLGDVVEIPEELI